MKTNNPPNKQKELRRGGLLNIRLTMEPTESKTEKIRIRNMENEKWNFLKIVKPPSFILKKLINSEIPITTTFKFAIIHQKRFCVK